MAPPSLAPPPRARLPSPLPVRSPAPDGRLSPPPWPHLRSPSPCSSAVPEPMVLLRLLIRAYPVAVRGLSRFFTRRFPRALAGNSGSRVDSVPWQFRFPPSQLRRPWVTPPAVGSHTQ
ncbi:uncharacterized protein LOC124795197 [Schistocerca piceifrons]|uniref:uncharacterized protein LOC124795197 n=1 Tax=Schistocerca piceifrons TaxID=274613 RepID=UPI001F5EAC0C|nr:uncharacterized protein LOC124795197 [Schistocerca piceifrons]